MTIDPRVRARSALMRGVAPLLLLSSACKSHGAPVKASEPATVRPDTRAIVESADEKIIGEGKKIRLLNPKAAVAR